MGAGEVDVPRGAGPRHGRVTEAPYPAPRPARGSARSLAEAGPAGSPRPAANYPPCWLGARRGARQRRGRAGGRGRTWGEGREPREPAPTEPRPRRRRDQGAGPRRVPEPGGAPGSHAARPPPLGRGIGSAVVPGASRPRPATLCFCEVPELGCRVPPSPRFPKSLCRVLPSAERPTTAIPPLVVAVPVPPGPQGPEQSPGYSEQGTCEPGCGGVLLESASRLGGRASGHLL